MTSAQLDPSAHAPCTSTTLRATNGAGPCAYAPDALNDAANKLAASAATIFNFVIGFPDLLFRLQHISKMSSSSRCESYALGSGISVKFAVNRHAHQSGGRNMAQFLRRPPRTQERQQCSIIQK